MKQILFCCFVFFSLKSLAAGFEREIDQKLYDASFQGNIKEIQTLLSKGANPNAQSAVGGMTPLMGAASGATDIEVLKILVEGGADIHKKDENGQSVINSIGPGGLGFVKYFIGLGADPNSQGVMANGQNKGLKMMSPLHFAVAEGNDEMVSFLLKAKANPNLTMGKSNLKPIDLAKKRALGKIVKTLEDAAASRSP